MRVIEYRFFPVSVKESYKSKEIDFFDKNCSMIPRYDMAFILWICKRGLQNIVFVKSSHRRCLIKRLFLKISQYSQELESPFNQIAGLKAWYLFVNIAKHRCFPMNIANFLRTPIWRTSANGCFCFDVGEGMYYSQTNKISKEYLLAV